MKKLSIFVAASTLLGAPACTEILNIDVHYDDGGGGAGPSSGGNAGSDGEGGSGLNNPNGGNGAGPSTGGNGGGPLCETPPAKAECFADEFEGTTSEPCWKVFDPHASDVGVEDGELKVQPTQMNAAWWLDSSLGITRGFFQYRNVAGDFAMVAKAKASDALNDQAAPPTDNGSYKMAGIFMRRPAVDDQHEDWVKLEVGFRGPGLMNNANTVQPMGVLGGVARGTDATHLHPYQEPVVNESWLGMCRDGNNLFLMFRYTDSGTFLPQLDQTQAIDMVEIDDCMEVGLIAGGYTGLPDVEGHFQQFRLVAGDDLSFGSSDDCNAMLMQLADAPADLGCGGC